MTNNPIAKKTKRLAEVICLSDDDNEDKTENDTSQTSSPVTTPVKQQVPSPVVTLSPSKPSTWTIDATDTIHIPELPSKYSDISKKAFEIRCRAIHFGIVEFDVDIEVVSLQPTEFEMKLTGGFLSNVNMKLSYSDVLTFYFSFQSQPPAALIRVRNEFAKLFNRYIPTADEHGRGFDPNAADERRRHIIFHLKALTPDMERIHTATIYHFLKKKRPKMDLRCVSGPRLQELYNLVRYAKVAESTPKKTPFFLKSEELVAKTVGLNGNKVRFDLSPDDLHGLNEGEFLNDNIIDFYLQYIYYEKLSEEDRKNTYLFNSFFYTRLTQKSKRESENISAAERRYNRVKRWLRNVDIFSKEHLIVPINQNAHWYIVLIQNPNNVPTEGDLLSDDEDEDADSGNKSKKKKRSSLLIEPPSGERASPKLQLDVIETLDEIDEVPSDDDVPLQINIESLVNSKAGFKSPSIIIFDSLHVGSKGRVAATLREFLQLEFDHKKNLPATVLNRKLYNLDTIPTIEAAVPQQRNYSDCGLYILQYVESYFLYRLLQTNVQLASTFTDGCEKNLTGSSKRKEILQVINQHVIAKDD